MTESTSTPAPTTTACAAAPADSGRHAGFSWLHSQTGLRWRLWDFVVAMASFWAAFALSPYTERMPAVWYMLTVGGLYGFLLSSVSRACGVPQPEHGVSTYEMAVTCLIAVGMAYFVFNAIVGLTLVRTYGRYIVALTLGFSVLGMTLPRFLLAHVMVRQPLRVILYGAGHKGMACLAQLRDSRLFSVVGFLDCNEALRGTTVEGVPVLGTIQEWTPERLRAREVDLVVLCVGPRLIHANAELLAGLRGGNIELLTLGALFEQYFRMVEIDHDCLPLLAARPFVLHNATNLVAKRFLDLAVASLALLLSLPFWPIIALLIKLDSPGPVFFPQTRVRRQGRLFTLYKFRSMRTDAEKDGARWASANDPRVTRLGRFLRLTRIDEWPQLWNVLKGEMSIVGPRPERPEFVSELARHIPFYDQRHLVPPGLTGWAQIRYRYGASEEDARHKLAYDLYYVRNMSLMLDIEILLRTVPLLMRGSR